MVFKVSTCKWRCQLSFETVFEWFAWKLTTQEHGNRCGLVQLPWSFDSQNVPAWLGLTLFYTGRALSAPPVVFLPWIFGECFKWAHFSWLCSFQYLTGPGKSIFGIFFQNFEKFCFEGIWSASILTRKSEKSKFNHFFSNKSYFFLLYLHST